MHVKAVGSPDSLVAATNSETPVGSMPAARPRINLILSTSIAITLFTDRRSEVSGS